MRARYIPERCVSRPPLTAYRRQPNIRDKLVRVKMPQNKKNPKSSLEAAALCRS